MSVQSAADKTPLISGWRTPLVILICGASIGALYQGITAAHPDWIDRKVGSDAHVAIVWDAKQPAFTIWETEFFNRSVRTFYDLGTGMTPAGQFETPLEVGFDGRLRADGMPVRPNYVLASASDWIDGVKVAEDTRHGFEDADEIELRVGRLGDRQEHVVPVFRGGGHPRFERHSDSRGPDCSARRL